jgi:transcriptional regulator with XRE-family HTH domain
MRDKGIDYTNLSERSGIDYTSIAQYCTGAKKLNTVTTLERLATGLGETICVFFPDEMARQTHISIIEIKNEIVESIRLYSSTMVIDTVERPQNFIEAADQKDAIKKITKSSK